VTGRSCEKLGRPERRASSWRSPAFLLAPPKGIEQPSGVFAYDPKRDGWHEVRSANPIPLERGGWMPLCYDTAHACLIGVSGTTFYAFRYAPD